MEWRYFRRESEMAGGEVSCGDPGLPIQNTWYAYNSRSHDQCVVNPHIRVDNKITSSITVPNNILTIGHMTKYDIAMQGKSTTKQRIPSRLMTHVMPTTLQATDWETFLVRTSVIVTIVTFRVVLSIVWPS
jgi:hypothetical protein